MHNYPSACLRTAFLNLECRTGDATSCAGDVGFAPHHNVRQDQVRLQAAAGGTNPSLSNRKIGRAHHIRERLSGVATQDETMKTALENYHARMQRVLDHID